MVNKTILHYIDIKMAPNYDMPLRYPPIFLVGAPRSGSTLVYQVLTDAFDVAYLSNFHCQFFGAPALAERIFLPLKGKECSDYASDYGQTKGKSAPSECGSWWYRFFPDRPDQKADNSEMRKFRRSLLALAASFNKPVIFKNLYVTLRLKAISTHIPEALFIVIKRNEIDNAHSIIEGRMKATGRYDQWWSVPPPDVERLKSLEPAWQAVEQIRSVYRLIDAEIEDGGIDRHRVYTIRYEDFCCDVKTTLKKIEDFFADHEVVIERRFSVPDKFPIRKRSIRIDKEIYSRLHEICEKSNINE